MMPHDTCGQGIDDDYDDGDGDGDDESDEKLSGISLDISKDNVIIKGLSNAIFILRLFTFMVEDILMSVMGALLGIGTFKNSFANWWRSCRFLQVQTTSDPLSFQVTGWAPAQTHHRLEHASTQLQRTRAL